MNAHNIVTSGVWPSFSQLDWINKIYPNLQPQDKPLECVQEEGEILYLVSIMGRKVFDHSFALKLNLDNPNPQ